MSECPALRLVRRRVELRRSANAVRSIPREREPSLPYGTASAGSIESPRSSPAARRVFRRARGQSPRAGYIPPRALLHQSRRLLCRAKRKFGFRPEFSALRDPRARDAGSGTQETPPGTWIRRSRKTRGAFPGVLPVGTRVPCGQLADPDPKVAGNAPASAPSTRPSRSGAARATNATSAASVAIFSGGKLHRLRVPRGLRRRAQGLQPGLLPLRAPRNGQRSTV